MIKDQKINIMKYRSIIGVFVLCLAVFSNGSAQVFERTRNVSRTFKANEGTSLEVYNKYGNINVFTWAKDSVKIDINLDIKANKQSKADKMYDYIDFEFSATKYYIIARTHVGQNEGSFWSELSDLASTLFTGGNKAQIDYSIYVPVGLDVKFVNKFGNIYTTDHKGKFSIDLSNGDLKANNITGPCTVSLNFGNANLNYIESGTIDIGYGELDVESIKEATITSKSSTIAINKAGTLKVDSRRDKITIGELKTIRGTSTFSYITLKNFTNYCEMTTEYGEISFDKIPGKFDRIDLISKYTEIQIYLAESLSADLDINHTETTGIYYPDAYKGLATETIDKKEDKYKTSGIIGNKQDATSKIQISTISGKVTLREMAGAF